MNPRTETKVEFFLERLAKKRRFFDWLFFIETHGDFRRGAEELLNRIDRERRNKERKTHKQQHDELAEWINKLKGVSDGESAT